MRVAAAACSLVLGLGCGVPGIYGALHLARTGLVWRPVDDWPTFGDGPFVSWGIPNSPTLILAFVAVCAADVVLGAMLLLAAPGTRPLAIALVPFEVIFSVGFALPVPPVLGIARTVLVLV